MVEARPLIQHALASALRPRSRLTVSEWADRHRVLSGVASSEAGRWRTSRTPMLREIMDCLSLHSPVQHVVVMKCIQVGVTEVALNWIGYIMDHAPAPTLLIEPTLDLRDKIATTRLKPMIDSTPVLREIMGPDKTRDGSNTQGVKLFPGGTLILGGANSGASLRQMPIRYVICDEADAFPWDVGGEGDPMGLIAGRQTTFPRRKTLEISSPTIKDASRIDADFMAGDQRYYHVPCPHCNAAIILKWKMLQWSKTPEGEVTAAWYVCDQCGAEIEEAQKPAMLAAGKWVPTAKPRRKYYRSYHIGCLYYPIGLGLSWQELAQEWIDAQADPAKLKRFINVRLGEAWEDRSRDLKANIIMQRAEAYQARTIPPGCLVLTAGVDTQDDRLAIHITGFGRDEQSWVIDYIEIPGDPARLLRDATRKQGALYDYLAQPIVNSFGIEMRLSAIAIDSGGHHTHDVYGFARAHSLPRIMAIKGASRPGQAILAPRPRPQDVTSRGRTIRKGVMLWMVGSDTAKHWVHNRLVADAGVEPESRRLRFPADLDADYYNQLLGEVFDPERNKWVKRRGRRNEALDCLGYSVAASMHPEVRVHRMRKRDWDALQRVLEPAEPKAMGGNRETDEPDNHRKPPRRRRRNRGRGFVGGF